MENTGNTRVPDKYQGTEQSRKVRNCWTADKGERRKHQETKPNRKTPFARVDEWRLLKN